MSLPDAGLISLVACAVSVVALAVSGGMLVLWLRGRSAKAELPVIPEVAAWLEAFAAREAEFAAEVAALRQRMEALEQGSVSECAGEALQDGRLNMSMRAQALQLLRAGISPDTAANTLGTATRDIRLLAKVSRLLTAR